MKNFSILSTKILRPELIRSAGDDQINITQQEFITVAPVRGYKNLLQESLLPIIDSGTSVNVAFTSSKAVYLAAEFLKEEKRTLLNWRIYCLKGSTLQAVKHKLSDHDIEIAATAVDALTLATAIIENDVRELLFFCGVQRLDILPDTLREAGIKILELQLYQTIATPSALNKHWDGILFFSPTAVDSFFSSNRIEKNTVCFAVGNTTAGRLKSLTGNPVVVSSEPSQEKMVDSVVRYFKEKIETKQIEQ